MVVHAMVVHAMVVHAMVVHGTEVGFGGKMQQEDEYAM